MTRPVEAIDQAPARPRATPHPHAPPRWITLAQATAGGLVAESAFPDRSWWPMAALGLALLVLALRRDSPRWCTLVGLVWGLAFFLPHVWWANQATGLLPWLALATLQAALTAVGAAAWAWTRRAPRLSGHGPWPAGAFAVVWVATEQLRSTWPFGGFPWGRLAFSQTDGPLLRLAWLGGAPAVSAAVAVSGFLLASAWLAIRGRQRRRALAAVVIVVALLLVSAALPLAGEAQAGTLRLAAVQGDIADDGAGKRARAVLDNHVAGTRALGEAVGDGQLDVVLWPENATDIDPRADSAAAAAIDGAARSVGAPILVGTDRYTDTGRYNEMLLWQPGRGPVFTYAKQRPAPFGEYIPLRGLVRLFSSEVDRVQVDMLPGNRPAVVPLNSPRLGRVVKLATVICFEVAFDDLVRDAVRNGAELLVVPTNNASFGRTAESTQQLAMSRLRAVEHGRATVQISTVGVSAVISPTGAIQERTALFTADTMLAELPLRTSRTPADQAGDGPVAIAVALALAGVAAGIAATPARRPSHPHDEHSLPRLRRTFMGTRRVG